MNFTKETHITAYPALAVSTDRLASTTILVTGAGSGIGRATALSLASAGASTLALLGRRSRELELTASAIASTNPHTKTLIFSGDVCCAPSVLANAPSFDVVIHAAGHHGGLQPLAKTDLQTATASLAVNITGAVALAQAVMPGLRDKQGVFIVLCSAAVLLPAIPGMGVYAAGKSGLLKLTEYLAAESPEVRFTTVHPGIVRTEMGMDLEAVGIKFPYDDDSLAPAFLTWAATDEAAFLKDKFVSANWDVEEMKQRKDEL